MLSNNTVNKFLTYEYDFKDDDIVDYYINFLKSLSLKIFQYPIELFYNKVTFYTVINFTEIQHIPNFKPVNAILQPPWRNGEDNRPQHNPLSPQTYPFYILVCEGNEKLYSYSTNFPFVVYFKLYTGGLYTLTQNVCLHTNHAIFSTVVPFSGSKVLAHDIACDCCRMSLTLWFSNFTFMEWENVLRKRLTSQL